MAREEVLTVKVQGKIDPSLKRGMAQTTKTAKMLGKNIDTVGREIKQIKTQPIEKLNRSMKKVGKTTKAAEKSMVNMGNALKLIGTVAAGVAVRGILKVSDDFERARSRLKRFSKTTEEQTELFKKLREASIRVVQTLMISHLSFRSLRSQRNDLIYRQIR